jgi:hypothetical protein
MLSHKSLAKKRNQDKLFDERKEFLKSETNASLIAIWEEKTSNKIEKNQVKKLAKEFEDQSRILLQLRQRRMKELYDDEASTWKEKITNLNQVSSEERMNEIRKRAEALRGKREKEENECCLKMLEKQRINGSEELRRTKTVIFHEVPLLAPTNTGEASRSSQPQFEIDSRDKENAKQVNKAMKLALDEQVRMNERRKSILNEQKRLDDKVQDEKWTRELMEEKTRSIIEKQEMRTRLNDELQTAILSKQNKRNREISECKRQEELLQKFALQPKGDDTSKVTDRINVSYVDSLKYQILTKNKDNPAVEAMREPLQDKIQKEKTQELRDREERKKMITSEIAMENKAKMYEKAMSKENVKKEITDFLQSELVRMKEVSTAEDAEARRKKNEAIENAKYNQAEFERKFRSRIAEKERQLAEEREASTRWQIV